MCNNCPGQQWRDLPQSPLVPLGGTSGSPGTGTGMCGVQLGPPWRSAVEVLGIFPVLDPLELLESSSYGQEFPLGRQQGLGLLSCPLASWESSLLHCCTAVAKNCCTKSSVCPLRQVYSSTVRTSSSRLQKHRLEVMRHCTAEAEHIPAPKICSSLWCSQGSRSWRIAGCWLKRYAHVCGVGGHPWKPWTCSL